MNILRSIWDQAGHLHLCAIFMIPVPISSITSSSGVSRVPLKSFKVSSELMNNEGNTGCGVNISWRVKVSRDWLEGDTVHGMCDVKDIWQASRSKEAR